MYLSMFQGLFEDLANHHNWFYRTYCNFKNYLTRITESKINSPKTQNGIDKAQQNDSQIPSWHLILCWVLSSKIENRERWESPQSRAVVVIVVFIRLSSAGRARSCHGPSREPGLQVSSFRKRTTTSEKKSFLKLTREYVGSVKRNYLVCDKVHYSRALAAVLGVS